MSRIEGVDVIKIIAITAVIVIHAAPFAGMASHGDIYRNLEIFLNQLSGFAVPFFFIVSGYFFGVKERRDNSKTIKHTIDTTKRLLFIFLAWCLIYLLPYNIGAIYQYGMGGPLKVAYWNFLNLMTDPIRVILHGTKAHLWFLAGLAWSVGFTGVFLYLGLRRSIYFIAAGLYILGMLGQSYSDSPFGIHFNFDIRNHIFFSTIFFVTGYGLSNFMPKPSWFLPGTVLFVFGVAIHFSEIYGLWKLYGTDPSIHSFTIGTYVMGMGITLAALSNHRILSINTLSNAGKYVLGIYVVHYIFVDILSPVSESVLNPAWEILKVPVVLILSAGTAMLLSKNKYTRKIVS